jgi:hypothetical protein
VAHASDGSTPARALNVPYQSAMCIISELTVPRTACGSHLVKRGIASG